MEAEHHTVEKLADELSNCEQRMERECEDRDISIRHGLHKTENDLARLNESICDCRNDHGALTAAVSRCEEALLSVQDLIHAHSEHLQSIEDEQPEIKTSIAHLLATTPTCDGYTSSLTLNIELDRAESVTLEANANVRLSAYGVDSARDGVDIPYSAGTSLHVSCGG